MTKRVLITAFEPYERWRENASWLALVELTKHLPSQPKLTTRRYPVDFELVRERLESDLAADYDYVLHLGQAPGSARIRLEYLAVNVRGHPHLPRDGYPPLVEGGPLSLDSNVPLADWAATIRAAGVPAQVSYHAGVYLCNATLYLSRYLTQRMNLRTRVAFLHIPLATSQMLCTEEDVPTLDTAHVVRALHGLLEQLR